MVFYDDPFMQRVQALNNADVELELIDRVMAIPRDELLANREELDSFLGDLYGSHTDTGWWGITCRNEHRFHAFAEWLRDVVPGAGYHSAFDISYHDMVTQFPTMENDLTHRMVSSWTPSEVGLVEAEVAAGRVRFSQLVLDHWVVEFFWHDRGIRSSSLRGRPESHGVTLSRMQEELDDWHAMHDEQEDDPR